MAEALLKVIRELWPFLVAKAPQGKDTRTGIAC